MTLQDDTEKVAFLISTLDRHIIKLPSENAFANYLESIRILLSTNDSNDQRAAISNSELLIDNLTYQLRNQITTKRAVGSLIASLNKVGYLDAMDAAEIILEFEQFLEQLSIEEAENICKERWET
ncbi:hypothetical protein FLT15_09220 [Paenibacillus thiaminolyticus]|uniref:hypothetical protein n=1 Tax=Paenibacillus thiaminolyticus TaxID=49283 RepID=UPI001165676B|nr:hypothetical protein [Paenibacillus thiaminolyticus]NGP58568.1 hypothetical protein [Paenibacillus thiaminolyticus]